MRNLLRHGHMDKIRNDEFKNCHAKTITFCGSHIDYMSSRSTCRLRVVHALYIPFLAT